MKIKKLLISFSGGRTSAYMTQRLLKGYKAVWSSEKGWFDGVTPEGNPVEIIVVFANTGREREETYEFARRCDVEFGLHMVWVEAIVDLRPRKGVRAKVVNFETANRDGAPFEAIMEKFGIPNQNNSFCSRDLKGETIKAYLRSIKWKGYHTALGIRADEPQRINLKSAAKRRIIYPLATVFRTTKSDVNLFWSKMPFDLQLKSYEGNCDLCWKKSLRKLMTLVKEKPELADWWREMERKYENHLGESRKQNKNIKLPMRFFRENKSINDIVADAQKPFTPAVDESKQVDQFKQMSFMDMVDENAEALIGEMVERGRPVNEIIQTLQARDLDIQDDGCAESCEAFAA